MNERPIPPLRLWWLAAGFAVWCSALVVLYALQAIGCTFGWPAGTLRLSLAVVLLAHLLAIGWLWRNFATASSAGPAHDRHSAFLRTVVVWTLIAAMTATVIAFGPPLLLTACV